MAAKHKELPDEGLYAAQQAITNSNPLAEAPFVMFPQRDGILVHMKSGVAYQPTWRGWDAVEVAANMAEDMRRLLESGEWMLNPNERPFDPERQQRLQQAAQEPPAQPKNGNGRPQNELDNHFADSPETVTKDGERYRDIVALKRMQETSKKDANKTYEYWIPYYADDKGDPKSIGRIMSWGQVADQLRAVVPADERGNNENGSKVFNKIIELSLPFRAYYTLKDIGNGRSASEFHRIEALA